MQPACLKDAAMNRHGAPQVLPKEKPPEVNADSGSLILGDDQYCTVIQSSDEHDVLIPPPSLRQMLRLNFGASPHCPRSDPVQKHDRWKWDDSIIRKGRRSPPS